jgi:hypothetical protein
MTRIRGNSGKSWLDARREAEIERRLSHPDARAAFEQIRRAVGSGAKLHVHDPPKAAARVPGEPLFLQIAALRHHGLDVHQEGRTVRLSLRAELRTMESAARLALPEDHKPGSDWELWAVNREAPTEDVLRDFEARLREWRRDWGTLREGARRREIAAEVAKCQKRLERVLIRVPSREGAARDKAIEANHRRLCVRYRDLDRDALLGAATKGPRDAALIVVGLQRGLSPRTILSLAKLGRRGRRGVSFPKTAHPSRPPPTTDTPPRMP